MFWGTLIKYWGAQIVPEIEQANEGDGKDKYQHEQMKYSRSSEI